MQFDWVTAVPHGPFYISTGALAGSFGRLRHAAIPQRPGRAPLLRESTGLPYESRRMSRRNALRCRSAP